MWYYGLLDLSAWQLVAVTLLMTHVTIVSVTIYLHRYSAHRALELNAGLKHFFRFWLWLTTAQNTREWTAIHRKHHAKCETPDDPHSPLHKGLGTVLRKGAELYREEARNEETLRIYGKNCPDDWIERNLYTRYKLGGIALMAVIDLLLFGTIGITIWAVQMMWIPFWAAGVVNGLGHAVGYRNFECRDAATNLVPWGIIIGGEELHNNHHTYPNSAKLSVRRWEFDMGWMWIRLLSMLRLAKVQRVAPIAHRVEGKASLDMDTAMAILNNRFQIMAQYRKLVIGPWSNRSWTRSTPRCATASAAPNACCRVRPACCRTVITCASNRCWRTARHSRPSMRSAWRCSRIWARTSANGHDMLAAMKDWVHEAEASGIQSLRDFAAQLKTYSLRPTGA